jgi:hypothetical protein
MAQLPMSEERWICAAKPSKPVSRPFGLATQPARRAGADRGLTGSFRSLADLTAAAQQLRQLGEVRRHAVRLVAGLGVLGRIVG